MRLKNVFGILLSLLTLVMLGCGDDGGGSPTTVKGTAAAGPVVGGTVALFPIVLDASGFPNKGTQLTTTPAIVKTKTFGNYSASVNYSGPLLVEVSGGTYTDEASGIVLTNLTMQAAVPNASGTIANVSVTPITSMTTQTSGKPAAGQTLSDFIKATNASVAKALGLPAGFDIITTPVTDPNYIFALQVVSQAAQTASGNSTDPIVLAQASTDAVTRIGGAIDPVLGTISVGPNAAAINQEVIQAKQDAFTKFNPPTIPGNTPIGVTLSATPATGVINNTVTITATVSALDTAATVPDTTTVTFTTSAGSITASATTTNGVATATLSGITTPQAVTVKASVGTIASAPLTVNFISDPNAPGGISITANPTTIFAGGSSTITATVTPAGTGGVIANGTVVTFATTVGTITASATTTNGVATATLTSAAAGTAAVTASVSGITSAPVNVVINALPVRAIVKLAINGTLPAGTTIDGAQFILNYVTNKGLSIVDAGIVASNGATASLIVNNLTVNGVINSAFANANASPIAAQTGEFATLTFTITGATTPFPALGDFTIASSSVATTPVLATPLTVSVLSVTLQ